MNSFEIQTIQTFGNETACAVLIVETSSAIP